MSGLEKAKRAQSRILSMRQVEDKTGLKKSIIYEMMKEGTVPRNFPLAGTRARGFLEFEIDDWFASRVELREAAA
jgi:prophage regulatory protein